MSDFTVQKPGTSPDLSVTSTTKSDNTTTVLMSDGKKIDITRKGVALGREWGEEVTVSVNGKVIYSDTK